MDSNFVVECVSEEATLEMTEALNTASGSLELSGTASPISEVVSEATEEPCPESSSCGGLAAVEIAAVLPLLKTCVDQLHILSYTNMKPRVIPNMKYKTLEERYVLFLAYADWRKGHKVLHPNIYLLTACYFPVPRLLEMKPALFEASSMIFVILVNGSFLSFLFAFI